MSPLSTTPQLCSLLLFLLSITIVYTGSLSSLRKPRNATPGDDEDEDSFLAESLSLQDAYWFPFAAAFILISLYMLLTLLDKETLNLILTIHITILAIPVISSTLVDTINLLTSSHSHKIIVSVSRGDGLWQLKFNQHHLFTLPLAIIISLLYFYSKHWFLSNILASGIAYKAFSLISLSDFKTGFVLLFGLFVYDVLFVFGSPIMLTVATGLEIPIKLCWPRSSGGYSLIGLGDIVLPGILVALSLRFDSFLHHSQHPNTPFRKSAFARTYFCTCFIAYTAGLFLTLIAMHLFKSAQPALLYLSPSCTLSVLLLAWKKGEINTLFTYSEDDEKPEKTA